MTMPLRTSSMPAPADRRRAKTPGFTMVEVLVAVGVLTVAFLGIITVFLAGYGDISQSGRDTLAAVAAQSLIEDIRNRPQADIPSLGGVDTASPTPCPLNPPALNTLCTDWVSQVSQLPAGRGTVAVTQTPNPGTGITMYRVAITVSWDEAGRGARQLTVVAGRSN